jgi:hypothetical protein
MLGVRCLRLVKVLQGKKFLSQVWKLRQSKLDQGRALSLPMPYHSPLRQINAAADMDGLAGNVATVRRA